METSESQKHNAIVGDGEDEDDDAVAVVNLPDELIREILIRLPNKSLMRFKAVSKQWNSVIGDPSFVKARRSCFRSLLSPLQIPIPPPLLGCPTTAFFHVHFHDY